MAQLYGPPSDGSVIPHELEDAIAADLTDDSRPIGASVGGKFAKKGEVAAAPPLENTVPGLARIGKAATAPFRIFLSGTSIANNSNSALKTVAEWIVSQHGDAGSVIQLAGGFGGSVDAPYQGWGRQVYGGPMFLRLRGSSTSSPITLNGNGDRLRITWSREADGAPFEVLVDGASIGTVGAAGAQAYRQVTEFTIPAGPHRVVVNPPATGYAYLEAIEVLSSTRKGVEVLDGTLGGSAVKNMVDIRSVVGQQVAGIPIVGDNGLNSFYDRDDVDLHLVSYTVNDAGAGSTWASGGYVEATNKIVERTRERGVPVVFVVEMGGHYSLTTSSNHAAFNVIRDHLLSLASHSHVTVIDWHAATVLEDKQRYMARYYSATNLDEAAGTFTGDFIHPNKSAYRVLEGQLARALPTSVPRRELPSQIAADRLRTMPAGGFDKKATVDGTVKRYAAPAGPAFQAISAGQNSYFQGRPVHYYRDTAATNIVATTQANIEASVNSDAFGKYLDLSNGGLGMGSAADWAGGEKAFLTVRASGTLSFRADADISFYADGVMIPDTDTVNARTLMNYVVGSGVEPLVFTVVVGSASASKTIYLSGRVYEVALVRSTVPILV